LGEGVHNFNQQREPFLITVKGGFIDLAVLVSTILQIRFDRLSALDVKILDQDKHVDPARRGARVINLWEQGFGIFHGYMAADLDADSSPSGYRQDFEHGSVPQGSNHNSLDGMHTVLGLIENNGSLRFEYLFGHFHAFQPEFLENLLADLGITIMESGQAVQELHIGVAG
jgi:hypothetical protein